MIFLDSCDLKQLVSQPSHLHGHILDLILFLCDKNIIGDVKMCDFIYDHALVTRSIAFSRQAIHAPNKCSIGVITISICPTTVIRKNIPFVKSPAMNNST